VLLHRFTAPNNLIFFNETEEEEGDHANCGGRGSVHLSRTEQK
jgi:hypothetical protein